MDTNSRTRWVLGLVIGATIVCGGVAAQRVSDPEMRLREALHKEQVEGDLAGAIKLYEGIASDKQSPRGLAAQALLNLGRCHEKMGNRAAQQAYERIVRQFADQGPTTAEARSRLAVLRVPSTTRSAGIISTKLATGGRLYSHNASADGRLVVAQASVSGYAVGAGFGVLDLTTGVVKQLPYDPDRRRGVPNFVISPDGKRIAYPGGVNGVADFRVMNVDGSGRRVFKPEGDYFTFAPMDWSHDERHIAVSMFKAQPAAEVPRLLPSFAMFDVAGGRFRVFDAAFAGLDSPGAFPLFMRLSPDGSHVAFVVRRPKRSDGAGADSEMAGDIYTMSIDATGRERLPVDEPAELVDWLPDGRGLAYVSERNGVRTMFGIPMQEGRARGPAVTLFRGVGRNQALGITSGGALTYAVDGRVMNSYIGDLRESPPVRTTIGTSDRDWTIGANWSPDGRHMAFVAIIPWTNEPASRLMIRDLSTGMNRLLLQSSGSIARGHSWTADGTSLLMARPAGRGTFGAGTFQVDRVDFATGTAQSLTAAEKPIAYPRLTPDGRHLYYLESETTIVRVDLTTKERAEIARVTEWFDLSRDGSLLAFVDRVETAPVIKIQPTDGRPARVLLRFQAEDRINSIALAPDGQSLAFAQSGDLFRVPLTGPSNVVALGVPVTSFPDIAIHPDNLRLAFLDSHWTIDFWQMNGLADAFEAATRTPAPGAARPAAESLRDR